MPYQIHGKELHEGDRFRLLSQYDAFGDVMVTHKSATEIEFRRPYLTEQGMASCETWTMEIDRVFSFEYRYHPTARIAVALGEED